MINLKSKRILIVGASSGIGKSTSRLCSELGARLVLFSRNSEKLDSVHRGLQGEGHLSITCDITDHDKLEKSINQAVQEGGPLDGLVFSAGMEMTRPLKMLKPKNLYEVLELNVVSGIEVVRVLSKPGNLNSEGASLILISSIVGFLGQAGKVGYSASKGAVLAASKSLSLELAARNIRVNSILPGMVRTEMSEKLMDSIGEEARNKIVKMHPLGIGTPEDVASACAFILSDAAKWITGTSFIVDGGYSAA